ncbi:hypothetical protein EMIT0P100_110084 [Pseudomonas sp. IT-P100]
MSGSPAGDRSAASRRTPRWRAIKHLYELYLLRTLKPQSRGHNLARTCHWNYVARMTLCLADS